MVTYVVSAFNRPDHLAGCLWALKVQTDGDFECLVADNAIDERVLSRQEHVVRSLADTRFRHIPMVNRMPGADCYWAAEWVVEHEAQGEWICLPSDDSYYVPLYQELMLEAAEANSWDLVYCDLLYDPRLSGRYKVLEAAARLCCIDKSNFLLRRARWIGFPDKPSPGVGSCADGLMIERLVRAGVRHGRVEQILCVHN